MTRRRTRTWSGLPRGTRCSKRCAGTVSTAQRRPSAGAACFHSLAHGAPARLDVYRARIVDGLGRVIHERLFTVEPAADATPCLRVPDLLGYLSPTTPPEALTEVASLPEAFSWLNEYALAPFLDEVRDERVDEIDRVSEHVELSLTEVLQRNDDEIGRAQEELDNEVAGAVGPIPDPARYPWHGGIKVAHYFLSVDALRQPMEIRETERGYSAEAGP